MNMSLESNAGTECAHQMMHLKLNQSTSGLEHNSMGGEIQQEVDTQELLRSYWLDPVSGKWYHYVPRNGSYFGGQFVPASCPIPRQ
jgi:hypothetical protein